VDQTIRCSANYHTSAVLISRLDHLRVIVYVDFVVYLFMVHLVGSQYEVVHQVPIPVPGTNILSLVRLHSYANDVRDHPFPAFMQTMLGDPEFPALKSN
jgi:hypothetical protein